MKDNKRSTHTMLLQSSVKIFENTKPNYEYYEYRAVSTITNY